MNQVFYILSLAIVGVALIGFGTAATYPVVFAAWIGLILYFLFRFSRPLWTNRQKANYLPRPTIDLIQSPVAVTIAHQLQNNMTIAEIEKLATSYLPYKSVWSKSYPVKN